MIDNINIYLDNPSNDIIRILKGKKALEKAELFFFNKKSKESKEWINKWTKLQQYGAILVMYLNTRGKNKQTKTLNIRFLIGKNSNLGEKYKISKNKLEKRGKDKINVLKYNNLVKIKQYM